MPTPIRVLATAALSAAALSSLALAPAALAEGITAPQLVDRHQDACGAALDGTVFPQRCALQKAAARSADAAAGTAGGAKRLTVAPHVPAFGVGDEFPVYSHNMLIDPPRYGLPAVTGDWRYYRVNGDVYRVDAHDRKVLEVLNSSGLAALR